MYVSKAAVCIIVKDVCQAIVEVLLPRYIEIPTDDSLRNILHGFTHKLGFPQCDGAVDGTHIPIISPNEYQLTTSNCKDWHSIILQGTHDHLYRLTDVCIGWPGCVHDARALGNCLYHRGSAGTLFPEYKK